MRSFIADYVYTIQADPLKNGIVTVDDAGKILSVTDDKTTLPADTEIETLSGVITPGFINTHCHTELSHLEGQIAPGNSLIPFIQDILGFRGKFEDAIIKEAAERADKQMRDNGIVAVGDISNTSFTANLKAASNLYYHTFVEILGFVPSGAEAAFQGALATLEKFKPQSASITAHAPYTVSKELFKLIKKYSDTGTNLLSIHNQECEEENKFYRYKLGAFLDLYKHLNINIDFFKPQARNSLQSIVPLLSNRQKVLLVHNTCTNLKDIYFIKRFDRKINWCFCPNANIYIEKRLPKIELFLNQDMNITLGTDSLASNTKLCILSEMQTIDKNFPSIGFDTLIKWATINGAEFLGIDDSKGSIEPGKTPGLNLLTGMDGTKLTPETTVRKLV
ncbi:amidohydrolase family protein [Mucilaginibacter pallidiroseus]|uniref:Amidohydrolase family protein n=1 Tax=Mucilaginibacter pallidiroseus TaxID=2599295 RepID=A0A563UGN1_9SPHI|nr:amidohydrolase family protein [Mucilaginibacter pallidiroseus]TWR30501.1 amidohydrolase family protein [Mucilaginibacter pallidiroseus]